MGRLLITILLSAIGISANAKAAWDSLVNNLPLSQKASIWTNDCAAWTMDAIFMQETIRNWK